MAVHLKTIMRDTVAGKNQNWNSIPDDKPNIERRNQRNYKRLSPKLFVLGWDLWCAGQITMKEYARLMDVSSPTLRKWIGDILDGKKIPDDLFKKAETVPRRKKKYLNAAEKRERAERWLEEHKLAYEREQRLADGMGKSDPAP